MMLSTSSELTPKPAAHDRQIGAFWLQIYRELGVFEDDASASKEATEQIKDGIANQQLEGVAGQRQNARSN